MTNLFFQGKLIRNGNQCLSHALPETERFYGDYMGTFNQDLSWMMRGCSYYSPTGAGLYCFSGHPSGATVSNTFRLTLVYNS